MQMVSILFLHNIHKQPNYCSIYIFLFCCIVYSLFTLKSFCLTNLLLWMAGGKPLLELNRVLRPGGYFIWSATPVYRQEKRDQDDWNGSWLSYSLENCYSTSSILVESYHLYGGYFSMLIEMSFSACAAMVTLTKSICWRTVVKSQVLNGIAVVIYQKPTSNSCYAERKSNEPPLCSKTDGSRFPW